MDLELYNTARTNEVTEQPQYVGIPELPEAPDTIPEGTTPNLMKQLRWRYGKESPESIQRLYRSVRWDTASPDPKADHLKINPRLAIRVQPLRVQKYGFHGDGSFGRKAEYMVFKGKSKNYEKGVPTLPDYDRFMRVSFSIILYNNPDIELEHFRKVCVSFMRWDRNVRVVKLPEGSKDKYEWIHILGDLSEVDVIKVIGEVFYSDYYSTILDNLEEMKLRGYPFEFRHHWYGDHIEVLRGMEKSKAKMAARTDSNDLAVREELIVAQKEYSLENWDALPTARHLTERVVHCKPTVVGHCEKYKEENGEDLIVKQGVNMLQRVIGYIRSKRNGDLTYTKIAEALGLSNRQVARYMPEARKRLAQLN